MKKLLLTLVTIICLALVLAAWPNAIAETFIYQLKKDGQALGKWGIETRVIGGEIHYKSLAEFPSFVRSATLLRNFAGFKNVIISTTDIQKMKTMSFSPLRWQVSTKRSELSIKRFENNNLMDEVKIYPVLPVNDFTSYMFSLRDKKDSFDFYLLEPGHEKRMHSEREGAYTWLLKFEDTPIIKVRLNHEGIPKTIDFGVCPAYDLKGYSLSLVCRKQGSLERSKQLSPQDILQAYVDTVDWAKLTGSLRCKARFVQGQKGAHQFLTSSYCISIKKDITDQIRKLIIRKMRNERATLPNFRENFVLIKHDRSSHMFLPIFNDSLISSRHVYALDDIYTEVSRSYSNVEFGRPFFTRDKLVIPYHYRFCSGTEYEDRIDLEKRFQDTFPESGLPDRFEAVTEDGKVIIMAYKKERKFFRTKYVALRDMTFYIDEFEKRFLQKYPSTARQLDKIWFETDLVGSLGILKVKYKICEYQRRRGQKVLDLTEEFSKACGIRHEYLVCKKILRRGDSFEVRFGITADLGIAESSLRRELERIKMATLMNPDVYLVEEDGRIILRGTSGLSLSRAIIFHLFKVPDNASVKVSGEKLQIRYVDLECR